MPVPVWDSDIVFLEEPLDTATVVSDDIWKKFDLDVPLDNYHYRYQNDILGASSSAASSLPPHCETPMMMHFDKLNCQASRKIRHHDCMWAGLCISKEHNRTHPAKKDNQIHRRIPAGRSLLISKVTNSQQQQQQQQQQQHQHQQSLQLSHNHQIQQQNQQYRQSSLTGNSGIYQSSYRTTMSTVVGATMTATTTMPSSGMMTTQTAMTTTMTTTKNLESDGDSTRPETPQSSESETESEDDDEEDEGPVFRHEQININDIVSMPVSEVTGQQIQRRPHSFDRRRDDDRTLRASESQETTIRNTLMSDHCYHLNQQPINNKKLEHLGVQTPSDSEEEIDVVSYEKPTRASNSTAASSLPTYPSPAEQQHFQLTVKTAFKERRGGSSSTTTAPRPRGRPPINGVSRKRANQAAASLDSEERKPAKRAKQHRTYQRRATPQKNKSNASSPQSSPSKLSAGHSSSLASSSRSSSDDEPDTEKRSLHNNMERQRRIELRNAFEELRILVPEVEAKEKAPKVAILRQAAAFCDRLTDLEQLNVAKALELRRKQDRLRAQLSHLRRSLAQQR